jgi:hypothetical protein
MGEVMKLAIDLIVIAGCFAIWWFIARWLAFATSSCVRSSSMTRNSSTGFMIFALDWW